MHITLHQGALASEIHEGKCHLLSTVELIFAEKSLEESKPDDISHTWYSQ